MEHIIEEFENKIIQHDASKTFPLPDECVDVCITSPPYWGLRDYGKDVYTIWDGDKNCKHEWGQILPKGGRTKRVEDGDPKHRKEGIAEGFALASGGSFCQSCDAWKGQLGLEPHPQMYINHLVQVAREIKRVLKKSGSFYLNLGDTYCSFGGISTPEQNAKSIIGATKSGCQRGARHITNLKNIRSNWLQPKQLMGMPWRVAIALQNDEWCLRNDIIWHKPNPMPSPVKDRLNNTFEHVFHFVKSRKYYYDLDAIRESYKFNRWGGRYKKNITTVKIKPGDKRAGGQGSLNRMDYDCYPHLGKNPGDVLDVTTKGYKEAHFAVFPLDLIDQPLKATLPREICRKCGKPRERIIKTNNPSKKHVDKDGLVDANKIQKTSNPQSIKSLHRNTSPDGKTKGVYYSGITIGWTDCGCNAGFDAGIVLDPFAGRGTVGKWCKENWGRYILFDIKPEYCEMAHLYIGGQKRKLINGQIKLMDRT